MKILLTILLSLILTIKSHSQSNSKYSKKELKEIVKAQQKQINELLIKNEELSKLVTKLHLVEEEKFNFLTQKNNLEKKIIEKENEISTKNKEKEFLLNSIVDYKNEIEEMNAVVALANKNSRHSNPQYQKEIRVNNSSTMNYYKKNTRRYITGPRGGCYYINGNGNKTYVDRSLCN